MKEGDCKICWALTQRRSTIDWLNIRTHLEKQRALNQREKRGPAESSLLEIVMVLAVQTLAQAPGADTMFPQTPVATRAN